MGILLWQFILSALVYFHLSHSKIQRKRDNNSGNEIYEIRIFETAPPGTKATLNEAFDRVMREQKNCFAQLETAWDTDWIEFDSALLIFITTADVPTTAKTTQQAVLHLMCVSNKMRSINFSIHVTRRNRHPPKFFADNIEFYAPATLPVGAELGRLQVLDNDPIIYNSQIQLDILPSVSKMSGASSPHISFPSKNMAGNSLANDIESHWSITKNGSIIIARPMTDLQLYRPYGIRVLAVDFGSPQLFSICNVTIVPVSVSQPRNIRVNVATTEYQIFEWDAPAFGIPEKYRISIRRHNTLLHTQEVEASENIVLSRVRFSTGPDYTVVITSEDVDGSSPSEPYSFILIKNELSCDGDCSPEGGIPLCYYGRFHKIEQYRDNSGAHCLCFDGFSSPQCDVIESCPSERVLESYGGVDWPFTPVNQSSSILCPYNANEDRLTRNCTWDSQLRMTRWQNVSNNEICKKQGSILVHLGVLANYAERPDQTASGLRAVQRFLATVLRMPAFQPTVKSAHFDAKIAEHVAQVVDTMAAVNLSLPGNITDISTGLVDYIIEFSRRLPVPFHLESVKNGFQLKTWHWLGSLLSENANEMGDEFPAQFGGRCYIHLPTRRRQRGRALIIQTDDSSVQIVRVACLRPTTMLPLLDGRSPVLFSFVDVENDDASQLVKKKHAKDSDELLDATNEKIVATDNVEVNYQQQIPYQKITNGATVLIALRPQPLPVTQGPFTRLNEYGDAGVNYTCAIYDHSKYGWSITGIKVMSRNFEDGFILCESTHLGVFALLPQSLFEAKQVALWKILFDLLPIATASFAALCTLFLLLIAVIQKPRCTDPALVLFLVAFLMLHILQLLILLGPHVINATTLAASDRIAYLCIQFSLLSITALLTLLTAATHARIVDLEAGVRRLVSICCRFISSILLGVAVPLLMCSITWFFDGHIYENIASLNPYMRAFNWAFAISFAFPFVLFVGSAAAYGGYSYYYVSIAASSMPVHHVSFLTSTTSPYSTSVTESGRQRLLKDLADAALISLLILLLLFINSIVFFQEAGIKRNAIMAILHLGISATVFVFTSLLYRVELKFPRYILRSHIGEVPRNFVSDAVSGDSAFFLNGDAAKENGNAYCNGKTPLICHETDSSTTKHTTVIDNNSTMKNKHSNGIQSYAQQQRIDSSSLLNESLIERQKSNYFTYDASTGRNAFERELASYHVAKEGGDDDSGRLTLNSPTPSSVQKNNNHDGLTREITFEIENSPTSGIGTASRSGNTNDNKRYGYQFYEFADIRRGSYSGGADITYDLFSNRRISYANNRERLSSVQYDGILSPSLARRNKDIMNRSLHLHDNRLDRQQNNEQNINNNNLSYRTAALQLQLQQREQDFNNTSITTTSTRSTPKTINTCTSNASRTSLLKIKFLNGKEMESLPHITISTTNQLKPPSGNIHRNSVVESDDLSSSSSYNSDTPSLIASQLLNSERNRKTTKTNEKMSKHAHDNYASDEDMHPIVSVV